MNTTEKPDYEIARDEAKALFDSLKLKVSIGFPVGNTRDNWPNISYAVNFADNRSEFSTEYHLGTGHVKWTIAYATAPNFVTAFIEAKKRNPNASFKDKGAEARAAAWLAAKQNVKPEPWAVLAAVCRDSLDAHGQSFEDWAANYGYDSDSRKAETIYWKPTTSKKPFKWPSPFTQSAQQPDL